jgi:N-acetylneuraminate synthase
MKIHELLRKPLYGKEFADIIIIGKGASIDSVHTHLLKDKIIININDSEKIVCGDIGVFRHDWVLHYFNATLPSCKLYITDRENNLIKKTPQVRSVSNSEENELFLDRFFDQETLWLENATIISCLRVANEIAKLFGIRKRVFLLGFDFSLDNGFSERIEDTLHGKDNSYVGKIIQTQELYLERLIEEKVRLDIDIIHVGDRPYSFYNVDAFNALLGVDNVIPSVISSNSLKNKNAQNVTIVAEITTNHFGDKERLKVMIVLAKQAGADYIKLQKRNVGTFYKNETLVKTHKSPFGTTFRDYRQGLELTKEDFEWVDYFCKKIGIGWFASILDEQSFEFIKQHKPDIIKLPSTISEKKNFLKKVGEEWTGGLVISTGMTNTDYENFVLESFKKCSKIYLLQCTSSYPAPEDDASIGVIRHYRDLSMKDTRIIPGFSSHDIGSFCSQLAVAAGARMVEKHVKLGSVNWAHFDDVALDLATNEFADFVRDVRRAERVVGSEIKMVFDSEHHKY